AVEGRDLLLASDEDRAEREVHLMAIQEIDRPDRAHAVENFRGGARPAGGAQDTPEGERLGHEIPRHDRRHHGLYPSAATKRFIPEPASSLRTRLMSSGSLRTQPRVSSTSSSSRWSACSDESACAQSSVSATPGNLASLTVRKLSMNFEISRASFWFTPGTFRVTIRTSFSKPG